MNSVPQKKKSRMQILLNKQNIFSNAFKKFCKCFYLLRKQKTNENIQKIIFSETTEGNKSETIYKKQLKTVIPNIPKKSTLKKTLVLDLDETLVHTRFDLDTEFDYDLHMQIPQENSNIWEGFIKLRPHVKHFIQEMSKLYEIIIFTASKQEYAEPLINHLDNSNNYIEYRLYRENCSQEEINPKLGKNLQILNRDLSQVIIIDNSRECFRYQVENGFEIEAFIGDPQDDQLQQIIPFLKFMSHLNDVRNVSQWYQIFNQNDQIKIIDQNANQQLVDAKNYNENSSTTIQDFPMEIPIDFTQFKLTNYQTSFIVMNKHIQQTNILETPTTKLIQAISRMEGKENFDSNRISEDEYLEKNDPNTQQLQEETDFILKKRPPSLHERRPLQDILSERSANDENNLNSPLNYK